ncbi:MAG TPA: tripartite tricarboxylate transporter substrate-binding protein [Beijerinckiaceae bacterium]|nr:tripartite tricarboxylate transporter substrate-binding protein [Beijerinckiaceae bacterium]
MIKLGLRSILALALGVAWIGKASAQTDAIADFYRGKTVTLMVGGSAGGGYDILSRALAKYLGKHIPGEPSIVVKNMPGAGTILLTNYMNSVAPKDGTYIASVANNAPFEPLYGTKEAQYDATKLVWLGSPSSEVSLLTIWKNSPADSIADARVHELTMGSSGANSTPSFYAHVLNAVLGLKLKLVVGYPGQNDALLAMERGEIDGYPSAFYNSLMSSRPTWIKDKQVKLLVQYGAEKEPALPDVPFAPDLITNAADKQLMEEASAPLALGRPYLMPPGVPADRVEAMRKAFFDTLKDPDFQADNQKLQLGANAPRTGQQLQDTIVHAYQAPPDVIDRLKKLLAE